MSKPLSDNELCAAVAEQVMGWRNAGDGLWDEGDRVYTHERSLLTWNGIGRVAEAMGNRGFPIMLLGNESGEWRCGFYNTKILHPIAYQDPSAQRAVLLAALKAVDHA